MTVRILDALVDICGPDYARPARSGDAVGGHRAGHVALPATAQAVGDVLGLAAGERLALLPRGSGSKIDWGTPREAVDLLLDTGRLSGLWNHDVTARTVEVAIGTPVRALQAALALRGQRLPVDPPSRTATVGGMLAVNESGPLRHRFGAPAEHVERVSYVDPAGVLSESDGEGDRPGLAEIAGVLTSAVVRLQQLPAARHWVTAPVSNPLQAAKLAAEASSHEVSAVETDLPAEGPGTVSALFEDADAGRLAAAWGVPVSPVAPPWWGQYPFGRGDVVLRISVAPDDLAATVYALADAVGRGVPVRGSAGLGNVHAVLPGTPAPERIEQIMATLGHVLMARSGRTVLVTAPPELAARLEMAGPHELF
ncbi:FAD-binding oxidoreductase [Paractinoplanes ferrugineus]|uniref:Glycolate oxidase n=1 Tax=Paractinoplanes ferrugineus TaxID=113564 RepID=A0A919J3X6_9ACTN|nr:FAD-binding oxidoreductase [Actinoplanes ferrugineus]GIE14035.1 glycolate oxidase [Actinoplanes ferrugineus]